MIPVAWGEFAGRLTFDPDRPKDRIQVHRWAIRQVSPGLYEFDAGLVPPGSYRLELDGYAFSQQVEVGPNGNRDVHVEVPEPADLVLTLLDAETREPVPANMLAWSFVGEQGGHVPKSVYRDPQTGRFEFRATQGTVELHGWMDDYAVFSEHVEVGPGANEFTLELRRSVRVSIVLEDGDAIVPWDDSLEKIEFRLLGGEGRIVGRRWQHRDQSHQVTLSQPGTYELTFPAIPGYLAIPPRTITVAEGEEHELVVELVGK